MRPGNDKSAPMDLQHRLATEPGRDRYPSEPATGALAKQRHRLPAAERREQLRRIAMAVFAERGYRGASMSEVAARAGVTKPVIYRHFRSKKDLYLELLDDAAENLLSRVWRGVEAGGDPFEAARRGFLTYFEFIARHAEAFRLLQSEAIEEPEILEKLETLKNRVMARICEFFEGAGITSGAQQRIAAVCIVGMVELAGRRLVLSGEADPESVASVAASLLVGGVEELLRRYAKQGVKGHGGNS